MSNKRKVSIAIVLIWLLLATSSAIAQTWSQLVTTGSPPVVFSNVAKYDSTSNRLIVFLPRGDVLTSDEVWVLTHANGLGGTPTWAQLHPTGMAPTINWGASAVYDAPANELIVYGGCSADCGSALSDVYGSHTPTGWEAHRRGPRAPQRAQSHESSTLLYTIREATA